jgi:regulatory protein YycI of two-component signal transduction system YycFG
MTEILYVILGMLTGGIIVYIYLNKKVSDTVDILTDSLVKNRLLKEEIGKSDKSKKNWKSSKKKYYGNKKRKSNS